MKTTEDLKKIALTAWHSPAFFLGLFAAALLFLATTGLGWVVSVLL